MSLKDLRKFIDKIEHSSGMGAFIVKAGAGQDINTGQDFLFLEMHFFSFS
jgi:hypothetical protein